MKTKENKKVTNEEVEEQDKILTEEEFRELGVDLSDPESEEVTPTWKDKAKRVTDVVLKAAGAIALAGGAIFGAVLLLGRGDDDKDEVDTIELNDDNYEVKDDKDED